MSPPSKLVADPLSEILSLLKPKSYAFRGIDAAGHWAIDFPTAGGLRCYALQSGECWLHVEGQDAPLRLEAGDCVLLPGGQAFRFGSDAASPPLDARQVFEAVEAGDVAVINGGGNCSGVGGYFTFAGGHADFLLNLLPTVVHFRRDIDRAAPSGSVERLTQELRRPQPGGALIAEHLAQMLLIQALRMHLMEGAGHQTGWLFALADKQLSLAMSAMHGDLGRRWTLQALANVAGMSRSSFAARFTATVGEPAMEYLTRWRMLIAADRLENAGGQIAVLAPTLGYESESAFGAAFKRVMGCSPRRFVGATSSAGADGVAPRRGLRSAA